MKCAICGGETTNSAWRGIPDFEYDTYHPVDFIRCARCGTIRQSPLPDAAAIPAFYPSDYRNHLVVGDGLFSSLKHAQTRWLARRIGRHIGSVDRKVLEIGCGSGGLLVALQDLGFRDLAGADFNDAGEPFLTRRGIRFRRVNIEQEFPFSERFDAVVMVNVIEHLLDPAGVLRRIREYLAPGGKVILITPNAGALELSLFGRFWSGFHAPRHIYLFSRGGFERMARSLGFAAVIVRAMADPGQWGISLQNACQETRFLRSRLSYGLAWYASFLALACAPLAVLQNLWPRRSTTIMAVLTAGETKDGNGGFGGD
ncbi:MAG: class I SAM-dependent methyltransferase [bacterium]|nr:class I SAM-dependent methyltransferase [bacterium]